MKKYLYESHMGGLYTSDDMMDCDELYCEQCGDSDWFVGSFDGVKEFWDLVKEDCDIDGSVGWSLQYIYPIMVSEFDLPDEVEYADDYERDCGLCDYSDLQILEKINHWIRDECKNG